MKNDGLQYDYACHKYLTGAARCQSSSRLSSPVCRKRQPRLPLSVKTCEKAFAPTPVYCKNHAKKTYDTDSRKPHKRPLLQCQMTCFIKNSPESGKPFPKTGKMYARIKRCHIPSVSGRMLFWKGTDVPWQAPCYPCSLRWSAV